MTIALAPEMERRLQTEAARKGLSPDQYANQVLDEHLSQAECERRESLMALLQEWIDEAGAEQEYPEQDEEFFRNLRENRVRFREITLPE